MKKLLCIWLTFLIVCATGAWSAPPESNPSYIGIELLNSNGVQRQELERLVNLKSDAGAARVAAAKTRLDKFFERSHIAANVEVVLAGNNQIALVVDVSDPLSSMMTRRLNSPHKVHIGSEKPFLILAEMHARLDRLKEEGRPAREEWREGYKFYSDEPVNQMIEEIQKFLPSLRKDLLEAVDCDPDPLRRTEAIELLEWCTVKTDDTSVNLLEALDDANLQVRMECARYFYSHINTLPPDFPYDALIEGLARMLDRPTYQDRSNALHCLLKLCQLKGDVVPLVKKQSEASLMHLSQQSILPTIKDRAARILQSFNQPAAVEGTSESSESPF